MVELVPTLLRQELARLAELEAAQLRPLLHLRPLGRCGRMPRARERGRTLRRWGGVLSRERRAADARHRPTAGPATAAASWPQRAAPPSTGRRRACGASTAVGLHSA